MTPEELKQWAINAAYDYLATYGRADGDVAKVRKAFDLAPGLQHNLLQAVQRMEKANPGTVSEHDVIILIEAWMMTNTAALRPNRFAALLAGE